MKDTLTIRGMISAKLMWRVLLRGSVLAMTGAAIIIYTGTQLSRSAVDYWGGPAFLLGMGLITIGLIPYRKLVKRSVKPAELLLDDESFTYIDDGKRCFSVLFRTIDRLEYVDGGIACWLQQPLEEKILVHNQFFPMKRFVRSSRFRHQCDLFFEHFPKDSFEELKEVICPTE